MEECQTKTGPTSQCTFAGYAGKGCASNEHSCVKEVLIEQGTKAGPAASTGKGTFSRLREDDKFRHRFLHTACVCWTMVAMGWRVGLVGPTFPDLRLIMQEDLATASWIFTAISLGGLIGSVCGGALYDRVNKTALYVCVTTCYGLVAAVTPWCSNFPAMFAVHMLHGGCANAIDTVVTADMVNVWKLETGPYLQAAHFAFTIGTMLSPFATKPFLAKRLEHFTEGDININDTGYVTPSLLNYDPSLISNVSTLISNPLNVTSSHDFEQFGESKIYVTYFVSTAISLSAAAVFIILHCRFGSVHAIADTSMLGSHGKLNRRVYTLSKIWKISLTILVAVMLTFYSMDEKNFSGFLMTFTVSGLKWSKDNGAIATSVYWVAFSCGRFTGIYAVKLLSISSVLGLYICILSVGTICLWLSVIYGIDLFVWISVALIGLGMSVIFASAFAWLSEKVRRLTGKITSIAFVFLSIGSMVIPIFTGYLMEEVAYIWFIYLQLILVIATCVLFVIMEVTHRWLMRRQTRVELGQCSHVQVADA